MSIFLQIFESKKPREMKTAKLIKEKLDGFNGHACLYKVDPPMRNRWEKKKHSYVICSTAVAMFTGVETYIFPANKKGEVVSWLELDGSKRGTSSHEVVLNDAGYELIN